MSDGLCEEGAPILRPTGSWEGALMQTMVENDGSYPRMSGAEAGQVEGPPARCQGGSCVSYWPTTAGLTS